MEAMRKIKLYNLIVTLLSATFLLLFLPNCKKEKTLKGVDLDKKELAIGYLNDTSGPAAAIGIPYSLGKDVLVKWVNSGKSGLLPAGWKIKAIKRDHGYNPQKSVELFREIKDDILFIGTSFGTPNTVPLIPQLERDKIVAFPASLQSFLGKNRYTPTTGPFYSTEAMRALDFSVEQAGGAANVKAGIIYQNDDFGKDGQGGWQKSAKHHKVTIVSEQPISPGQKDYTATITALKKSGATHVFLATLPSSTGPILGTALRLDYKPLWIGGTPAWIDAFFSPKVIPSVVFSNFYYTFGLPYVREDVPGMTQFLSNFKNYGGGQRLDTYVLLSYIQGLLQVHAFKLAMDKKDVSREGYLEALQSMGSFDLGGMVQPINFFFPYEASQKVRILRPDFTKSTWSVASDYKVPTALQ